MYNVQEEVEALRRIAKFGVVGISAEQTLENNLKFMAHKVAVEPSVSDYKYSFTSTTTGTTIQWNSTNYPGTWNQ